MQEVCGGLRAAMTDLPFEVVVVLIGFVVGGFVIWAFTHQDPDFNQ